MRHSLLIVSALALSLDLSAAQYSVSPGGDDAAGGTVAAPWKTLAHAAAQAQPGDTVTLRQGVYRESLVTQRSGTASAPIIFQGASGEEAVLCGANLVTGTWSLHSGKIWQIDGLPATWDVYVDGQQMTLARWPNAALGSSMDTGWATAATGTNQNTLMDSNLPTTDFTGAKVRIVPGSAWVAYSRTVQNYGGGQLSFDTSIGPNSSYYPKAGNRYILYRHLGLLDSAGEWFQDPATLRLYLWLPAGDSPAAHQIEIASRKVLATISAHSYIQLRDLFTFSGAISFTNSSGSKVVQVQQKYVHTNDDVDGYNFPPTPNQFSGGSGCEWSGGSIEGSSGDGIFLSGTGHQVTDMLIHDVCRIGTYRGAVRTNGSGHLIEHNRFYDSGRFLIYHGGTKGGALRYNELYNAGLLTKDLGATYCFQTDGGGMEIAYNHVHDVHCEVGAGIYLDNASSRFNVHHNLVHDVDWFALKLNLPSYDNIVVNNTLFATKYWVNAAGAQFAQEMTGTAIVNNLSSGGSKLITGAFGPTLITNGTYTAPPAVFNSGAWTLAPGSPAIDKGTVYSPYATVYCGAKPDQGCFESACGTAWSAGDRLTPPPFIYPLPGGSPSPTLSYTRTPTPSVTKSPTFSVTQTASPTRTRTASSITTASMSATASPSSSVTATGGASASATRSLTRTGTPTPSPSASPTFSASASMSATRTASLTSSPASSASGTPSFTRSASPSATPTSTPSVSSTFSRTLSPSLTCSWSPSPTMTPSFSATPSASASVTTSATASPTPQASPSVSNTPGSTALSTAVPTPRGEGRLLILRALPVPNPGPHALWVELDGTAEELQLSLWSASLTKVLQVNCGAFSSGPHLIELPAAARELPSGSYYFRLEARQGARRSPPFLGKVLQWH